MISKQLLHFLRSLLNGIKPASSSLLFICLITLSSCRVPPSFGYAFAGTGAVMVVGLVIATFVTRRNKRRDGEGE